jgi:NtrC-family two-component system sensor histidine kinase KinB
MALKLKSRVALGGMFLFLLLALVGSVSFYHFNRLISTSKGILKANYETVEFGKNMLLALSNWKTNKAQAHASFEANLQKQESNITEAGEKGLTAALRKNFNLLAQYPDSLFLLSMVQGDISRIIDINLKAINQKTMASQDAAEDAKVLITIIITVCLLIGFTFIVNFPSLIAAPITKLTEAIKAVANKNYSHRIHLDRKDEFGEMADAFNNMAEQLDKYEHSNLARIMFEKQRAETVINAFKDASIGIDNKGVILFANEQALQLLNINGTDMAGKAQDEIKKKNDLFRFLVENDNKTPFKVVVNDRENYFTKENIEITSAGEKLGRVITVQNITSFKEMDVAKTNFIATISHELKTPLASSDFSLKLLEDNRIGELTNEQKELVQQLKDDNQRMLRILSELLNMSQVEAGKIQLDIRPVNPYQAVETSIMAVNTTAKEKSVLIEQKAATGLPDIQADPDKIGWVLNNFLTNAIKYSPAQGTVSIDVSIENNHLSFAVTDQGPGIEEVYLDRIFERYFQVPGRSDKKGSGIGLAICKEFIEAMDGAIWVKSKPGEGSTFGFTMPALQT